MSAIGYFFHEAWAKSNPDSIAGFLAATRATKILLKRSDSEWQRLADAKVIRDKGVALRILRDRYREGIPTRAVADEQQDAALLYKRLAELVSGDLTYHLGMTLWRVAAAFFLAMFIGSAIGLLLGMSATDNRIFDPWVVLLLNIPALVIIVLAYVWIGLTEAAAIGAVAVNKIPNVIVTMREGAKALEPAYREVAQVFRLNRWEIFWHVVPPQMQPFIAAATRSGIAPLIWKIVLVVELSGRSTGVGFQIHLYFQLFDVAAILGYTMAFVLAMLTAELFVLQPFERHTTRWCSRNV